MESLCAEWRGNYGDTSGHGFENLQTRSAAGAKRNDGGEGLAVILAYVGHGSGDLDAGQAAQSQDRRCRARANDSQRDARQPGAEPGPNIACERNGRLDIGVIIHQADENDAGEWRGGRGGAVEIRRIDSVGHHGNTGRRGNVQQLVSFAIAADNMTESGVKNGPFQARELARGDGRIEPANRRALTGSVTAHHFGFDIVPVIDDGRGGAHGFGNRLDTSRHVDAVEMHQIEVLAAHRARESRRHLAGRVIQHG